jgi:hypothetical protein
MLNESYLANRHIISYVHVDRENVRHYFYQILRPEGGFRGALGGIGPSDHPSHPVLVYGHFSCNRHARAVILHYIRNYFSAHPGRFLLRDNCPGHGCSLEPGVTRYWWLFFFLLYIFAYWFLDFSDKNFLMSFLFNLFRVIPGLPWSITMIRQGVSSDSRIRNINKTRSRILQKNVFFNS